MYVTQFQLEINPISSIFGTRITCTAWFYFYRELYGLRDVHIEPKGLNVLSFICHTWSHAMQEQNAYLIGSKCACRSSIFFYILWLRDLKKGINPSRAQQVSSSLWVLIAIGVNYHSNLIHSPLMVYMSTKHYPNSMYIKQFKSPWYGFYESYYIRKQIWENCHMS